MLASLFEAAVGNFCDHSIRNEGCGAENTPPILTATQPKECRWHDQTQTLGECNPAVLCHHHEAGLNVHADVAQPSMAETDLI